MIDLHVHSKYSLDCEIDLNDTLGVNNVDCNIENDVMKWINSVENKIAFK